MNVYAANAAINILTPNEKKIHKIVKIKHVLNC